MAGGTLLFLSPHMAWWLFIISSVVPLRRLQNNIGWLRKALIQNNTLQVSASASEDNTKSSDHIACCVTPAAV